MSAAILKPECRKCKFFFITWEKRAPYGCRAFAFKSAKIPSIEVYKSSGMECRRFEKKNSNQSE